MCSQIAKRSDHQLVLPAPVTDVLSCQMMKKLTGACVSTISFCRALFDEDDFEMKSFGGVNIRIIKDGDDKPGVKCLTKWLQGAFDAIERKFLKTLEFDIKDSEGQLLERYQFHYSYVNNEMRYCMEAGDKSDTSAEPQEVKGATRNQITTMLRNILVACSAQNALPSSCVTSVKLLYYNEVTPEEYQPPGFKPYHGEDVDFIEPVSKWRCGKVETGFHSLIVKARQIEIALDSSLDASRKGAQCPCGLKDTSGNILKCENCDTLQHSACFKIFSEGDSQSQRIHKCMKCSGLESTESFDSGECVFRRILYLCTKSKSISIKNLTSELKLDPESAMLNIKRLQREEVVPKTTLQLVSLEKIDFPHKINRANLNNIIKSKYSK